MLKLHISKLLLLLLLLTGVSATYFLQRQALNAAHQNQKDNFDYQTREITLRIEQRLATYEQVLLGTKSLFAASKEVNRDEFRNYVGNLYLENRFPGIQGVGFSLLIQPSEKAKHIQIVRNEGFPNYTLHPEGERDLYTAIIYLEPFTGRNLRAFGYDMLSESVRRNALEQARDLDKATISGKVKLLQETEQHVQSGFLMYVPVYRNDRPHNTLDERRANIVGWVYAPFRLDDLMLGILGEQTQNIDLNIYDGEATTPEALMNNIESNLPMPPIDTAQYHFSHKIEFAGHIWTITLHSLPTFETKIDTERVMVIRLAGILTTLLLSFLIMLLSSGRSRALKLAESMTRELRTSENNLRHVSLYTRNLIEASLDPLVTISSEGKITDVNIATERVTGVDKDNLIGSDFTDYFTDPEMASKGYQQVFSQGFVTDYPLAIRHVSGKITDVLYNANIYRNDTGEIQGIFAAARDITERKKMEIAREEVLSLLQNIANRVPGVVYQYHLRKDGSSCFPFASEGIREIYRVSPEEVREDASKVFAILHPDDYGGIVDSILASANTLTQWNYEYRVKFDDGAVRWLFGNALPELVTDGSTLWHGFITDITERKQIEQSLKRESEKNLALLRNASDGIHILDFEGNIVEASDSFCTMLGYQRDEIIGMNVSQWDAFYIGSELLLALRQQFIKPTRSLFETCHRRKDGSLLDVEVSGFPLQLDGKPALFNSSRDITERKQNDKKLRLAANVFTHAREGIMITELDGTIVDVNETFSLITGYSRDEVIGQNPRMLSSGRYDKEFYATLWRDLTEKGHWYGEIWNRQKNGEVYAEMQSISAVRNAHGNIQHFVSLFSDITLIKDHEQELEHVAHYDALTNLPNRVLLADRLQQAMHQVQRRKQHLVVVFLDLDGFKAINDNHGHKAGDQLLMAVATSMKQTLREGDTLARLGGDEFVAVLTDLIDIEACVPMLTRLLVAAAHTVHIGDLVLQVSASLGATAYPQVDDIDADQLLRQADQAMYQAKLAGKNRYHIFDAAHDNSIRVRHESLDRIHDAILKQEFVLYYQPKVNMRTGAIIGAEALIRWNHPDKGLLSPALFLSEIEDHPLAIELGEWVIDTALTQIELWRKQGLDIHVSVNIGARQLQQANFVMRLREILAAHPDIMPSYLELEVLETSALEDINKASLLIDDCRKLGVSFALDDFGTGYSSLTYLRRLPVALLKIDQSFVRDMLNDPDDLAIIEGIVGLARTFRLEVIAEGVETVEHGALLLKLGCDMGQGYGIARPMTADQLPKWSLTWRPDSAWVNQPLMSHDDLQLLFASIEQRSWIAAIEAFLKGERDAPLPIDPYQSRLRMWFNTESLANYSAHPALEAIDSLCRQIQVLSTALCELQTLDKNSEAIARLSELHDLGDALIEKLKVPVQKTKH
ncbi:MAG: EAL domain-containing protein [Methylobacter sp.]|nr:EAL domain-containing protein [Methylobacter sp.]